MTRRNLKATHSGRSPISPALARTLAGLATVAAGLEPRASLPTVTTGTSKGWRGGNPFEPSREDQRAAVRPHKGENQGGGP
jgi:hypothetical protein